VAGEQQDLPSHFPSLPMENSPPGIHTMPSGAGLDGFEELATVGAKDEVAEEPGSAAKRMASGGIQRQVARTRCRVFMII